MFERSGPILKLACLALAALLLVQVARLVLRRNPLAGVTVPVLSASPVSSNAPPNPQATNAIAVGGPTNAATVPRPTGPVPPPRTGRPGPARPGAGLPPVVQARVEHITQSEILAPIMRPLPMALLGIAGPDVFLRAPNGQTGLLREGEELGGVKLLQVDTNRVLIEHEGQKKELMLFAGFGSESLLPKGNPK